jgi:hypothetical protein
LKAKLIQQQQLQLAKCYSSKTKTPKKATTSLGKKPENQKNKSWRLLLLLLLLLLVRKKKRRIAAGAQKTNKEK